jgi:N utilization substance protein A
MRIIDSICRDKNIERDSLVADIEMAMTTAVRKHYEEAEDAQVKIDLISGEISATVDGAPIDVRILGRIAAQAAKQMIIQKTRDRERTSIYDDFTARRGTIVTGTIIRSEGGNLLINIGRTEGFLPRSEQIPGETHEPGERLRALILEVREQPNQIKIILSRSHPEFIERLFELEVPEVAEHIIEIKALAREAGYRTKVAVSSIDSKVDAVGACVGVRGSRIKNIVDELGGEKIDIVRWNESSQILIQNALKPAEVQEIALCFELGKATVVVAEDQLSLAIGKRGQNVRLAARLTRWDVDILTPTEYNKHLEQMERIVKSVEGVDDVLIDKLIAFGCVSVADIDEMGPEPLVNELELEAELCERLVEACGEEVIHMEEEREARVKAEAEAIAAGKPLPGKESAEATAGSALDAALDSSTDNAAPSEDAAESTEVEPVAADDTPGEETPAADAEPTPAPAPEAMSPGETLDAALAAPVETSDSTDNAPPVSTPANDIPIMPATNPEPEAEAEAPQPENAPSADENTP